MKILSFVSKALILALESRCWVRRPVFCRTTLNSFPPHLKRVFCHMCSHQFTDIVLFDTKLKKDGLERCSILPGHLYNSIYFFVVKFDHEKSFSLELRSFLSDLTFLSTLFVTSPSMNSSNSSVA